MNRTLRGFVMASTALAVVGMAPAAADVGAAAVLNVRDFGATGNGSSNDSPAIDRAITVANATAGGATVRFPSGTYKSQNTIHMKSNVTLQLDSGAVGDHRTALDPHRLTAGQQAPSDGEGRIVPELNLHG